MMPDLERFGGVTGWVGTAALGTPGTCPSRPASSPS